MPTLFCCILNCETESLNSKKRKIFYRLPQNADRKQLWLSQIGDRIKYGTISANSRICNAHFATGKPNLDSSHVDHVPTIFPWSSKDDRAKSHQAVEQYESKIKDLEQKILAKAFMTASSDSKMSPDVEVTTFEPQDYSRLVSDHDLETRTRATKDIQSDNVYPGVSRPGMANRVPPPSPQDNDNSFSLNHNLLNYLISSLSQVNVVSKTDANNIRTHQTVATPFVGPTCPLNLSQSYNKIEEMKEVLKTDLNSQTTITTKSQSFNSPESNGDSFNAQVPKSSHLGQTTTGQTPLVVEEPNCRSCTCTKSSCLKLYCECFASGNLCSSGCTCFNCRNNNDHKEERAKIVSSYLERDPWVFSSKIDNQEVGKKHTKGCNCLKSSCLKNYCECFENKVFCSSLCRCRLCYNNEDHSHQNHQREDTKIYSASHTSDSISVISENSPREIGRKRKKSIVKVNGIYEDVSSNESEDEFSTKRRQLDVATTSTEVSTSLDPETSGGVRTINSMDIPPTLPQEDDFTEEELALMLKFKEQRSVKMESVSPPIESPSSQNTPATFVPQSPVAPPPAPITVSFTPTPSTLSSSQIKPKSLAGSALIHSGLQVNGHQESVSRLLGSDLLNLLVSQQLMVSRQSSSSTSTSSSTALSSPNYSHVIPINLAQLTPPQSLLPQPLVTPSRPPLITTSQASMSCSESKHKLSTEDYVRRHIEAAERAVRADNMRRDCIGTRKATTTTSIHKQQKVKIEPVAPPVSPQRTTNSITTIQPPTLTKQPSDDFTPLNGGGPLTVSQASSSSSCLITASRTPPLLDVCGSLQSNCSPAFTKAVQLMHRSSYKLAEAQQNPSSETATMKVRTTTGSSGRKWRDKYKSLRRSLHNMRTELRSIKVHMRADQSKIRRLESVLLHMSNELHN